MVGSTPEVSEFAGYSGATQSLTPLPTFPAPGAVVINGITVPFVVQTSLPSGFSPDPNFTGSYVAGPVDSPGAVP